MTERPPFITTPAHLAQLEGKRYVVLRVRGSVNREYQLARERLHALLGERASYPNAGHVTLRGFPAGTSVDELRAIVRRWAAMTRPIRVSVERPSAFPSPYQIAILEVVKTARLNAAHAALVTAARRGGLPEIPNAVPLDRYTFHLSLAYCDHLTAREWKSVERLVATLPTPRVRCTVSEVEVVAYDAGIERTSAYPLGAGG